ncbi:hypothetical protein [Pelagibius sp.]|uniref:hypothetical protein n=1 Tax=Pelagibius sp. TaxID=1931238 RepID=UPI00261EB743|nr:hypothetical protein [Pelagibius sp.]
MHPKLGDKLATPGNPPMAAAQPNGAAVGDETATISDTALVQAVHAVYRGDTDRHLGLLRQSGLLAGAAAGKSAGSSVGSSAPLKAVPKEPNKQPKPSGKSEVARRIQKALSFSF